MNPAHAHLLLNHIPVLGVALGLVVLAWTTLKPQVPLTRCALGLFVLSALAAVPTYLSGEPAEAIVERAAGGIEAWVEPHEEAASVALALVVGLGALVTGRHLAGRRRRRRIAGADGQPRRTDPTHGDSERATRTKLGRDGTRTSVTCACAWGERQQNDRNARTDDVVAGARTHRPSSTSRRTSATAATEHGRYAIAPGAPWPDSSSTEWTSRRSGERLTHHTGFRPNSPEALATQQCTHGPAGAVAGG